MAGLDRQIAQEEESMELAAAASGIFITDHSHVEVSANLLQDPKFGFKNMGEYCKAVKVAKTSPHAMDERLRIVSAAPTTFGSESAGADGGFLIPPQFGTEIFTISLSEDSLLPMTDSYDIESNSMVFPKDETTPWGTDGIRAFWQAEGSAGTQTKPKLGNNTLYLKKLMALVPLTDELVADGPSLGQYITRKAADSIRYKMNEAILFGQGNGTPLGALVGPAALVIAKDSGQATLTLTIGNVSNMVAALPPGSFPKAVWLLNNNVLPALFTLTLGNYPIYLPFGNGQGGAQLSPYGTLLGRPIMISQHAASFTSQGDVNLLDLSYYRTIKKAAGIETATSMHLYFDADAVAFRVLFRVDGQPTIVAPIKPAKATQSLSPFLSLQAR
jgi:HK97 family phage major capsid protein